MMDTLTRCHLLLAAPAITLLFGKLSRDEMSLGQIRSAIATKLKTRNELNLSSSLVFREAREFRELNPQ